MQCNYIIKFLSPVFKFLNLHHALKDLSSTSTTIINLPKTIVTADVNAHWLLWYLLFFEEKDNTRLYFLKKIRN